MAENPLEKWDQPVPPVRWDGGAMSPWTEQPAAGGTWTEQDAASGLWVEQPTS